MFVAVVRNLGAVVGTEGAVESIPGNEGRVAPAATGARSHAVSPCIFDILKAGPEDEASESYQVPVVDRV